MDRVLTATEAGALQGLDSAQPAFSLFADAGGFDEFDRVASATRGRVLTRAALDAGVAVEAGLGDVVLVEIGTDGGPALDRFLATLNARTALAATPLIVACPPECIDPVFAATDAARTDILPSATPLDRQLAVARALLAARNPCWRLNDVASDEGLRLQRLADEIGRIAKALTGIVGGDETGASAAFSDGLIGYRSGPMAREIETDAISAGEVRAIIRLRRLRERFFPSDLFADPGWDMLLDLFAARIERTRVAVSSLCIAADVPPTTALRWIKTMSDKGLFVRVADPHDARRVFIQLSEDAAAGMESYLLTAKATSMSGTVVA